MNQTDEVLMGQVREGDLRKLALLFERHNRSLYNFFLHMNGRSDLSQDLVQEVFFRILRYRHTYADGRPFAPWMYQIARNTSAEFAQKRRTELRLVSEPDEDVSSVPEPQSKDPGAEESLRKRQEIGILQRALERLPDDKRELLVLSRFQNVKYDEIAQMLGCDVGAVKVRVYRAVRALSQIYFELSGEKAS